MPYTAILHLDDVTLITTIFRLGHYEQEQRGGEESRVQMRPFAGTQGDSDVKPALMTFFAFPCHSLTQGVSPQESSQLRSMLSIQFL